MADNGADVISCSWGPTDGTGATVPLPTATRLAIRYCLEHGRMGKGIPIFWAAGNGSELVTGDGYASNPDVMAIAACTAEETPAPYSDFGPEIFACAPSSGSANQPRIFTTDRQGSVGYNPGLVNRGDLQGDYTNDFGGTSAAAPLVAGITALALSLNPNLAASQVRDLLCQTADKIGASASYDLKGHSDLFGYGRINAAKLVTAVRQTMNPPTIPSIIGPTSWPRGSQPPSFQVDPSPRTYYVVEVTSDPKLFDSSNHAQERTTDNFYGSWLDNPFQTNPNYTLSTMPWEHLQSADRLWYRVGASLSATAYVDYVASTADDQGPQAPSIQISAPELLVQASFQKRQTISALVRGESKLFKEPWIEGPLCWDRRFGPPTFRLEVDNRYVYRVDVSTDKNLLDELQGTNAVSNSLFFTSDWILNPPTVQSPPNYFQGYVIPVDAWQSLQEARQLYYRVVIDRILMIASPILAVDLTGKVMKVTKNSGTMYRLSEAVWKLPSTQPLRQRLKKSPQKVSPEFPENFEKD